MTELVAKFDAAGDNNTGSTGHWTGSVVTHDITIYPNSGISSSASMFLDNNAGQVWEFFSDVSGFFGVFDKTDSNQAFQLTRVSGSGGGVFYDLNLTGGLSLSGSLRVKARTVTANYTVTSEDCLVLANGASTVTLPDATWFPAGGHVVTIKNLTTSAVTIGTTSSQTIDGAASYSLPASAQYKFVTVVSDGSNWFVTAN